MDSYGSGGAGAGAFGAPTGPAFGAAGFDAEPSQQIMVRNVRIFSLLSMIVC